MEINELAKNLRALMGQNSPQLALASLAGSGQGNVQLSEEFIAAAKTLAQRQQETREGSILSSTNQLWF